MTEDTTYDITDHGDGKTYTVREHKPKPKQEQTTDELIAEARKLFRTTQGPTPAPKPKTKFELELDQSKKQWEQYFREHPDKIPYKFPKTFLDKE
jgi:hypothetical protein